MPTRTGCCHDLALLIFKEPPSNAQIVLTRLESFAATAGAHVDSPGHLLVNQYPGYTEQLPERCITAQKEDLALRWIMLPDLAVSLVGMYAASACLF